MKKVIHALENVGVVFGPGDQEFLRRKPRRFFRLKSATPEQKAAIIKEAWDWIGTKYHPHARVKGSGCDCAQLLIGVVEGAKVLSGIVVRKGYSTVVPRGSEYVDVILQYCDEITEAEAQPGDLALYKTGHGWMHSAIIVEWS